jgi:hypothetical protein
MRPVASAALLGIAVFCYPLPLTARTLGEDLLLVCFVMAPPSQVRTSCGGTGSAEQTAVAVARAD